MRWCRGADMGCRASALSNQQRHHGRQRTRGWRGEKRQPTNAVQPLGTETVPPRNTPRPGEAEHDRPPPEPTRAEASRFVGTVARSATGLVTSIAANRDGNLTGSQLEFFRLLDERIEMGKDYSPIDVT